MPSLGNGSACCDGLSGPAGGRIPPYGTHTFCISDFLLEFLFLALLSKYLAFHSAAKCAGIRGAGSVAGFTSSSRQAPGGPRDPRTGSGTRGAAAAESRTVPCCRWVRNLVGVGRQSKPWGARKIQLETRQT